MMIGIAINIKTESNAMETRININNKELN